MSKYFTNTLWILGEKVLTLGVSFALSIWLARHLGPEKFGMFSYGIALVGLFSMLGHLGLEGLTVRELVNNPGNQTTILATIFFMKFAAYTISFLLLFFWTIIKHGFSSAEFYIIFVLSISLLFLPFDSLDYWFQAKVQIKYASLSKIIGNFISSLAKIICIIISAGLIWFAYAHLLIGMISALLLFAFYKKITNYSWGKFNPDWKLGWALLKQGMIIFLGAMAAIIYLKIDQVMIEHYLGPKSVGIYAVAATLSEAWYFLPVAIMSSLFPKLIKLREISKEQYDQSIQLILDCLCFGAILLAVFILMTADYLIVALYGVEYQPAADVLKIHIWAGVFIFMRALFSKWILMESLLWLSLLSQLLGAIGNIVLNMLFIPKYGIQGAAWATLISYSLASYFALWLTPETRALAWMMTKALFSPIRLPLIIRQIRTSI